MVDLFMHGWTLELLLYCIIPDFLWLLHMAMARSSFGSIAISYVLPVLWMTSRLHIMEYGPLVACCCCIAALLQHNRLTRLLHCMVASCASDDWCQTRCAGILEAKFAMHHYLVVRSFILCSGKGGVLFCGCCLFIFFNSLLPTFINEYF